MPNKIYKFHIVTFEGDTEFGVDSFIQAHSKIHAWHCVLRDDGYIAGQIENSEEIKTSLDFVEITQLDGRVDTIQLEPDCSIRIENAGDMDVEMASEAYDSYWGGGFSNDSDTTTVTLHKGLSHIYVWEVGSQIFMVRSMYTNSNLPKQHVTTDFISSELWEEELITLQKEGWIQQ